MVGAEAAQKAEARVQQHSQKAQTHTQGIDHNVEGGDPRVVGNVVTDPSLQAREQANEALGGAQRNY